MSMDVLFASLWGEPNDLSLERKDWGEVYCLLERKRPLAPPKPAARPPLTAIGFLHRNNCSFATQKCERCQKRFSQCSRIWGDTRITLTWRTIDQYVEPAAVDHCQSGFLRAATIATLRLFTLFLTPQFHNTAVIHILFQGCNKCLKPKKRISAEISKNSIASQNICSAKTPPWDIAQSSARAGHRGKLVIKLYPFELPCVPDVCPR